MNSLHSRYTPMKIEGKITTEFTDAHTHGHTHKLTGAHTLTRHTTHVHMNKIGKIFNKSEKLNKRKINRLIHARTHVRARQIGKKNRIPSGRRVDDDRTSNTYAS